jgi:hypothetical protein
MGKVIEWGKSKKKNQKTATGIRSIVCYARLCYKKKRKKDDDDVYIKSFFKYYLDACLVWVIYNTSTVKYE